MNISTLATVALGQMPRGRLEERVSPPKRIFVPFTLGIRENTRLTVTVREVLFTITEILFSAICIVSFQTGIFVTRLLFLVFEILICKYFDL